MPATLKINAGVLWRKLRD